MIEPTVDAEAFSMFIRALVAPMVTGATLAALWYLFQDMTS